MRPPSVNGNKLLPRKGPTGSGLFRRPLAPGRRRGERIIVPERTPTLWRRDVDESSSLQHGQDGAAWQLDAQRLVIALAAARAGGGSAQWGSSGASESLHSASQHMLHNHLQAAPPGSALQDTAVAHAAIPQTTTGSMASSGSSYHDSMMSSMDEYSTRDLDFSDLALGEEESLQDGAKDGGAVSLYTKANYEVLRLDATAKARRFYVRRRDLLREHRLQPRDLRRIDPTIDFTKTSPSITIKEDVLLLNLGGVRAIVTGEKALLFEPSSVTTRKFLEVVLPRLQTSSHVRRQAAARGEPSAYVRASHADYMARFYQVKDDNQQEQEQAQRVPPFELEILEGALTVAVGRLDAEMSAATQRISQLLTKLPGDISPINLEELRRMKQALVELEDKADTLREMLEELMDDEDELRELNLSSRPRREDRRRQRERNRLEREVERAREIKEELEERALDDGQPITLASPTPGSGAGTAAALPLGLPPNGFGSGPRLNGVSFAAYGPGAASQQAVRPGPGPAGPAGVGGSSGNTVMPSAIAGNTGMAAGSSIAYVTGASSPSMPPPASTSYSHSMPASSNGTGSSSSRGSGNAGRSNRGPGSRYERLKELRSKYDRDRLRELRARFGWVREGRDSPSGGDGDDAGRDGGGGRPSREERRKELMEDADFMSRLGDSEEDLQEAQDALEEMVEEEEEEAELEEVEDLLEYYLQRASAIQSEAERMLAGARDLEESIGVSLSARRYEVNRLELMLSIGSFAAAVGAMLAGLFGMNMRSNLEHSAISFWGVSAAIILGCAYIFVAVMRYTQSKRIL